MKTKKNVKGLWLSVAVFELTRAMRQDSFCMFVIFFSHGQLFWNLLGTFELKYRKTITEYPFLSIEELH
jgi:hypothetical protein